MSRGSPLQLTRSRLVRSDTPGRSGTHRCSRGTSPWRNLTSAKKHQHKGRPEKNADSAMYAKSSRVSLGTMADVACEVLASVDERAR